MIVHIIGQTLYTRDMYEFINNNFNHSDQVFMTGKAFDADATAPIGLGRKNGDVNIISPKKIFTYLKILKNCDGIIIHGIFSPKHLLLIALHKKWLKKACWIIWGGDIYVHNKENKTIKEKITDFVKKKTAPKIGFIAPLVDKDYNFAQKWYGVTGVKVPINYPTPLQNTKIIQMLSRASDIKEHKSDKEALNIMIGNSATETNCHMEAINALAQYKNENIKIYLPLSYGSSGYERYAQEVTEYAESIFGKDKIIPIRNKMASDEYCELLSKIDVAVFYNNRQQAMGNIAIMLEAGAKVYIRDDTNMWNHYIERGYSLENAFDISKQSFETFASYNISKKEINVELIKKYTNPDNLKVKWENLFNVMLTGDK